MIKKILEFYQNHKVLSIFAVFTILIIINVFFFREKEIRPGFNSWNNIVIGERVSQEQLQNLEPVNVEKTDVGTAYEYKSGYKIFPNEVIVDDNQRTQFIIEQVEVNTNHTLNQYIVELGEYDLKLAVPSYADTVSAAVFLDDGLVVIFNDTTNNKSVVQKWYFIPTDEETFLSTWGNELEEPESELIPHPSIIEPGSIE